MEELRKLVLETIKKYPNLKEQISDLLQLCIDEIEEGGSRQHEIDLCRGEIQYLVDQQK